MKCQLHYVNAPILQLASFVPHPLNSSPPGPISGVRMNPSSPAPSELTLASTLDGRDVTNDVDNSPVKAEPGETSVPVQGSGEPVTTTVVTEAVDSSPPNKKTRLETKDGDQGVAVSNAPKTPGFLKLPLELLSDILIRAGSPEYVLAVARTCKSLCHTLLSRDAEFIWREARQSPGIVYQHEITTCKLLDPPAEFFSEAAYAAFVFSSGKCDVSRLCHPWAWTYLFPGVLAGDLCTIFVVCY